LWSPVIALFDFTRPLGALLPQSLTGNRFGTFAPKGENGFVAARNRFMTVS
jgi:hypothetical protein